MSQQVALFGDENHGEAEWSEILSVVRSVVVTLAALIWWISISSRLELSGITDLGLLAIFTPAHYVALLLLTANFIYDLCQRKLQFVTLLLQVAALIVMLFGVTTLVEEAPRFGPSWKHVGVAEYIRRTGGLDPTIDAYFSWPGFFALVAFITELSGMDILNFPMLDWASVYANLLYLPPLLLIFQAGSRDWRVSWLAAWLFFATNWIGQDYFSPQATSYFLVLVIYAVLLQWFQTPIPWLSTFARPKERKPPRWMERWINDFYRLIPEERSEVGTTPAQRMALSALIVALYTVIVMSHQLTPFTVLLTVSLWVLFNRCSLRGLPLLMGVILLFWINFMAVGYVAGHLPGVVDQVGQLGSAVSASVTSRLQGSPNHQLVTNMRVVMSLVVWGLAFLGAIRRYWLKRFDLSFAIAALAPFFLLVLQNYGGELLLRTYLYALPFMVFFIATLFFPSEVHGRSLYTPLLIGAACVVLLAGFLITRYGNEKMDYFTWRELEAVNEVYKRAQPDALFGTASNNLPFKFVNYEQYHYAAFYQDILTDQPDAILARMKNSKNNGAFLLMTRSQAAYLELFFGYSPAAWQAFLDKLRSNPQLRVVYENPDAVLFELMPVLP